MGRGTIRRCERRRTIVIDVGLKIDRRYGPTFNYRVQGHVTRPIAFTTDTIQIITVTRSTREMVIRFMATVFEIVIESPTTCFDGIACNPIKG